MLEEAFEGSAEMLLIVPFGPRARPRLCVATREDLADWPVLVESIDAIDGVRSAASEMVFLRPRTVPLLLAAADAFPATIFNAQLVSETEEDRRDD